jgi:hypothetical protein
MIGSSLKNYQILFNLFSGGGRGGSGGRGGNRGGGKLKVPEILFLID